MVEVDEVVVMAILKVVLAQMMLMMLFAWLVTHSFIHPFIHPFIHSPIHPFIHLEYTVQFFIQSLLAPSLDVCSEAFPAELRRKRVKVITSFLGSLSEVLEWTGDGPVSVEAEDE